MVTKQLEKIGKMVSTQLERLNQIGGIKSCQ